MRRGTRSSSARSAREGGTKKMFDDTLPKRRSRRLDLFADKDIRLAGNSPRHARTLADRRGEDGRTSSSSLSLPVPSHSPGCSRQRHPNRSNLSPHGLAGSARWPSFKPLAQRSCSSMGQQLSSRTNSWSEKPRSFDRLLICSLIQSGSRPRSSRPHFNRHGRCEADRRGGTL